jgi:type III secretory pathway component EscS
MAFTNLHPLLQVVLAILVVGVIVWVIKSLPQIDEAFRHVAVVLLVALLVIFALFIVFGWLGAVIK